MLTLLYVVCDEADIDPATQQCTHPQYVQAPMMFPPLSASAGAEIATAMLTVLALVAVYRRL